jgi:hypothetical protein
MEEKVIENGKVRKKEKVGKKNVSSNGIVRK